MSFCPKSNIAIGIEFDDFDDAEEFYDNIKNPEAHKIEIINVEYNTNFIGCIVGINILNENGSYMQEIDPVVMFKSIQDAHKTLNTILNNNPEIKTWFYQGEE